MELSQLHTDPAYRLLLEQIATRYQQGRTQISQVLNSQILETYWTIGQYIVEFEQGGEPLATYGKALLQKLSQDLSQQYGKGFSHTNLGYMRSFYKHYPIYQTVSGKLTWSHYVELLKIDDKLERSFLSANTSFTYPIGRSYGLK